MIYNTVLTNITLFITDLERDWKMHITFIYDFVCIYYNIIIL